MQQITPPWRKSSRPPGAVSAFLYILSRQAQPWVSQFVLAFQASTACGTNGAVENLSIVRSHTDGHRLRRVSWIILCIFVTLRVTVKTYTDMSLSYLWLVQVADANSPHKHKTFGCLCGLDLHDSLSLVWLWHEGRASPSTTTMTLVGLLQTCQHTYFESSGWW